MLRTYIFVLQVAVATVLYPTASENKAKCDSDVVALKQAKIDCDQRIRDLEFKYSQPQFSQNTRDTSDMQVKLDAAMNDKQAIWSDVQTFLNQFDMLITSNTETSTISKATPLTLPAVLQIIRVIITMLGRSKESSNWQSRYEALLQSNNDMKSQLTQLRSSLSTSESNLQSCTLSVSNLSKMSSSINSAERKFEATLQTCNTQLQSCLAESRTLNLNIQEMTTRLQNSENGSAQCTRLQSEMNASVLESNRQKQQLTSALNECTVSINRLEISLNQCTTSLQLSRTNSDATRQSAANLDLMRSQMENMRSSYETRISTLNNQAVSYKSMIDTLRTQVEQCQTSLRSANSNLSSQSDMQKLREKVQFLYEMAGYCRQRFMELYKDKQSVSKIYTDFNSLIMTILPLTTIQGDLNTKCEYVFNERANLKKKLELIATLLKGFSNKVEDYTMSFTTDGFSKVTDTSETSSTKTVYMSDSDGVDINSLTDLGKCRSAAIFLKNKISTISMNLNTALKNNSECLGRFGNVASQMIGRSPGKDDY